jgi:hypothetical protein
MASSSGTASLRRTAPELHRMLLKPVREALDNEVQMHWARFGPNAGQGDTGAT